MKFMKLEDEISINKFGQGLISKSHLARKFEGLNYLGKKAYLNDLILLILQSKPEHNDIEPAVINSELKPTCSACLLIREGVEPHTLQELVHLPESEQDHVFNLFLSLFGIAYQRRFEIEKNAPGKWWYWDLSDEENYKIIESTI